MNARAVVQLIRIGLLALCAAAASPASAQSYAPGACSEVPGSQTCVDTTPCKTDSSGVQVCLANATLPAGAVQVASTCWQYSYQYACLGAITDTCAQYRDNPECGVIQSVCNDTLAETGQCDEWTYTYQCQTQAQQTGSEMSCTDGLFNTSQFTAPANQNDSFILAAVGLEAMGEGQNYTNGQTIFSGVSESCRKGYGGIQNCCKSSPGAESNSVVMSIGLSVASSVVKYAGEKAVDLASPYVFDFMYQNGLFGAGALQFASTATTVQGGTALAGDGLSAGAFGFTVGFGSMPAGLFGGNIALFSGSEGYLAFNPYAFAIAVIIQVIENLMSCSQSEQLLAMHKGANLSTFVDETCSKSILGTCIQYVDNYCSFNSELAEIINVQGKEQLGLAIAGCSGLTPAQLQQIDFTKIDFGPFEAQIMAQAEQYMPTNSTISTSYGTVMQSQPTGTAQSSTSAVLPTYPASSQ